MTTPSSYATIADLKAATGDDSIAADDPIALRLIQFASAKIDEFCGQTFPIDPATDVPVIVTAVCAAVAGRAWQNPGGAQARTDVTGPFTTTDSFGSQATASVPMALRTSEKDDLSRYTIRRSGIGTIATYRPVPICDTVWIDTTDGGKPFPWPNPDDV